MAVTYSVSGMSCGHCESAVTREIWLPCRFRGSLSRGGERNTPYPGYVSTCEGTKRKNLDTACDLQGYGLGCSVSKRP
jgi:hypothetical protein